MKIKYVHDKNMKLVHISECEQNKNYYCINPDCHCKVAIKDGGERTQHPSHIGKPCTYTDDEALVYVCKKIIMEHVCSHVEGYPPPTFTTPDYDTLTTPLVSKFSDEISDRLLKAIDLQYEYYSDCDLAINILHQSNNIYQIFTVYIKFKLGNTNTKYYLDKELGHQVLEINVNDEFIYDMDMNALKYYLIESICDKEWKNIPTRKDRMSKHRLFESRIDIHRSKNKKTIKNCPLIPPKNEFEIKKCLSCLFRQSIKKTFIMCSGAWGIFDSESFYDRIREVNDHEEKT